MKVLRFSAAALSLALLAACGGGGSSDGSNGVAATCPTSEPAIPASSYSGSQAQASLDAANAYDYQQSMFAGINFIEQNVPKESFPVKRSYQQTIQGSTGSILVCGTINPDQSGWIEEILSDYTSAEFPGEVENGAVLFFQNSGATTLTLGFDNYSAKVDGTTFIYSGSIVGTSKSENLAGTVSVSVGSAQLLLSNLAINGLSQGPIETVSGRIYDSQQGYVDIQTPAPGVFGGSYITGNFPDFYLDNDGSSSVHTEVKLNGASGTSLDLQIMNGYFMYLGLDSNGDGKIDQGARLDMTTGQLDALQATGTSISPIIEVPNWTGAGPITLDGRYSYTPGGFVSYSWNLLAAPLGSAATLSGTGPTAQFTPDVMGGYLVELTVSTAGKSAFTVVPLNYGSALSATQYAAPNYLRGHVGEKVTLDGRASPAYSRLYQPSGDIWTLHAPVGSHATITDPTALVTNFTPDVPGVYYAVLGLVDGMFESSSSSVNVIAVDEDLRLAPPALIGTASGDVGKARFGSTADSLVFQVQGSSPSIEWWTLSADGLFTETGNVVTSSLQGPLTITDLNGDGVPDFVVQPSSGCNMGFLQSGSGSYSLSTVPVETSLFPCLNYQGISDVFSTTMGGKPAVVGIESNTSEKIVTFPSDGAGHMGTPVTTAVASSEYVLNDSLADLNGDGKTDLMAAMEGNTLGATPVLNIYLGDDSGNFSLHGSVGLSSTPTAMVTGDFNGDGKTDVALVSGTTLYIYYGDGSGGLSAPDTRNLSCNADLLRAVDLNNDGHPDLVVDEICSGRSSFGFPELGMLLSGESNGQWSLGNESFYPMPQVGPPLQFNSVLPGDFMVPGNFDGSGLQSLMLGDNSNIWWVPQLPSTTSASTVSDAARVAVRTAAEIKPHQGQPWHRALTKTIAPMLRPDAAPR